MRTDTPLCPPPSASRDPGSMHRPSRVCSRREHAAVRRRYADRVGDDFDVRCAGCLRASLDDGLLHGRHLDLCVRTRRSPFRAFSDVALFVRNVL